MASVVFSDTSLNPNGEGSTDGDNGHVVDYGLAVENGLALENGGPVENGLVIENGHAGAIVNFAFEDKDGELIRDNNDVR